ncbi:MAG: 50S ribosomal protein L21 [Patescibacteria group bacterium]|jgi:large subunit ribosomal protein L21
MDTFAVIATGGKQYLVKEGDVLQVEKLEGEAKAKLTFDQVLLVAKGKTPTVGKPFIAGAKVEAELMNQMQGKKIYVETYKAKTRKHRKIGHRQQLTKVKITKITG